jgi:hypothetical protein
MKTIEIGLCLVGLMASGLAAGCAMQTDLEEQSVATEESALSSGSVGTVTYSGAPCTGICSPDIYFTGPPYTSPNIGSGIGCYYTYLQPSGGTCYNMGSRALKINDEPQARVCNGTNWQRAIPGRRNGGWCIKITAGTPDYAGFTLF